MNQSLTTRLSNIVGIVVASIIILLPFHEFLTTWTASNFNHYDLFRVWKEVVLLLITPLILYIIYKSPIIKKWFINDWLIRLIFLYIALNILTEIWSYSTNRVSSFALVDGLIIDLRFPVFFIFAAVAAYRAKFLKNNWQMILLLPAALVVLFGIIELFIPINFLRHFGYGPKTTPSYETVDQKLQYHRIKSTLRGPNPFGAYLILIISACFINLKKQKWFKITLLCLSVIALFFTYSRSAYIGVVITLVTLYYLIKLNKKWRKQFVVICGVLFIVLASFTLALRNNNTAENVLFHTSKSSTSAASSNSTRLSALSAGLHDAEHHPFGQGPGTAGPASVHNAQHPKIAENYYIQVAQETGWLGVILFITINILVGVKLYKKQNDPLACLLLASLVGISFVNLISHEWADDTLSLIWWGMAGIMLTPAIIKPGKE